MTRRSILFGLLATCTLHVVVVVPTGRAEAAGDATIEQGEFTAKLNGLDLWYKVSGDGPICVMPSPGWGPSSDLYFRTLKPLEEHFTIVYLDTRGTGRSERAASADRYTWDHLVSDLEALRVHLEQDRVWLMGHSEGGIQVLHYACQHPQRVNGLVLLATMANAGPADALDLMARATRRKQDLGISEEEFADTLKTYAAGPGDSDEEMAAWMQKLLPTYWADPARIAAHEAHFAATSMSIDASRGAQASRSDPFDLTEKLKNVTAPALIVVGDKDIICPPPKSRQIHLSLPNSKLLHFEDCGHFPWLEQAEQFNSQVPKFLGTLGLRPQK